MLHSWIPITSQRTSESECESQSQERRDSALAWQNHTRLSSSACKSAETGNRTYMPGVHMPLGTTYSCRAAGKMGQHAPCQGHTNTCIFWYTSLNMAAEGNPAVYLKRPPRALSSKARSRSSTLTNDALPTSGAAAGGLPPSTLLPASCCCAARREPSLRGGTTGCPAPPSVPEAPEAAGAPLAADEVRVRNRAYSCSAVVVMLGTRSFSPAPPSMHCQSTSGASRKPPDFLLHVQVA